MKLLCPMFASLNCCLHDVSFAKFRVTALLMYNVYNISNKPCGFRNLTVKDVKEIKCREKFDGRKFCARMDGGQGLPFAQALRRTDNHQ